MKNKTGALLRILVSLGALGGLIYFLRGRLGESIALIREGLQWDWFLLSFAAYFGALIIISFRLQLVFRVQEVRVNYRQSLYLSFLGLFFNLFFPSSIGGDVAKGYFAYQYSGKKLGSLTGVVVDRLLGFGTIVLIALIAFLAASRSFALPVIHQMLYAALGILVFGTVFLSSPRFAGIFHFLGVLIPSAKWRQNLTDLYQAIRRFGNHPGLLWMCLGLSVAAQMVFFACGFLFAKSLNLHVPYWVFFVLMPLIAFVSMAPSLSGLGVREAGFVFFFKSWMTSEEAFALSLVYDIVFYGSALLAGIVFAFKGGLRKEIIHDLEAAEKLQEVRG